jgi:uncharacterized protein
MDKTKIQELKRTAAAINYRNLSVSQFGTLVEDYTNSLGQRIVKGYGLTWNTPNEYGESYLKGSCSKSIRERGPGSNANYEIKFLNQHKQDDPLSLFAVLREDDYGLYFETVPLDEIPSASRVLTQLASRTLNNFSIGFDYVWDKMEYDAENDLLIMKEIELFEISVVSIPADMSTYAVRGIEEVEDLYDETDDFIKSLPRKVQMQARQLFARHKSLIDLEPLENRLKALKTTEPVETGIDYDFLLQNLKLF